jgi:hypothetical protein
MPDNVAPKMSYSPRWTASWATGVASVADVLNPSIRIIRAAYFIHLLLQHSMTSGLESAQTPQYGLCTMVLCESLSFLVGVDKLPLVR